MSGDTRDCSCPATISAFVGNRRVLKTDPNHLTRDRRLHNLSTRISSKQFQVQFRNALDLEGLSGGGLNPPWAPGDSHWSQAFSTMLRSEEHTSELQSRL